MTALTWPASLKPRDTSADYIARSVSGGPGFDGTETVVSRDAGVWRIRLSAIQIRTASQVRDFRGLVLGLDGRSGTVIVPICEAGRSPRTARVAGSPIGTSIVNPPFFRRWPKLAGSPYEFSGETGITGTALIVSADSFDFAYTGTVPTVGQFVTLQGVQREIVSVTASGAGHVRVTFGRLLSLSAPVSGAVVAKVNAMAAIRATQIAITVTTGIPPVAGQYFSLGGSHLHGISSVVSVVGTVATIKIRPPLRAAVAVNDPVEFDNPVCECRLTSDDQALLLSLNKFASPSLEFMEAR